MQRRLDQQLLQPDSAGGPPTLSELDARRESPLRSAKTAARVTTRVSSGTDIAFVVV